MTMTLLDYSQAIRKHLSIVGKPTIKDSFLADVADAIDAHLAQPAQSVDDSALLNFMERECVTVRCEATDDDDVFYEVVDYYMDEPKERVISTGSTPREALTAALTEKVMGKLPKNVADAVERVDYFLAGCKPELADMQTIHAELHRLTDRLNAADALLRSSALFLQDMHILPPEETCDASVQLLARIQSHLQGAGE